MSTPEGRVKEKIKKILKSYDCVWWMPAAAYGRSGVSDFNVLYKGIFIAIEAKAGKGKLTALQSKYLFEVQEKGGLAWTIYDGNEGFIKEAMDHMEWTEERYAQYFQNT